MTDHALELTDPGRHVVAGRMADPLISSASKAWRGVMVELFPSSASDFTAIFENHGITLYLNGSVNMLQWFDGKVARNQMRRGNVILSPAGAPKRFQYEGGGEFLVVHVAPNLLRKIAEDSTSDASKDVEILNNFCTRDALIERLAIQLWDEYRTEDIASGICAESLANQLAVHLLRRYSSVGKVVPHPATKLSSKTLARALDFIEANLSNDLTIEGIAEALSVSSGHFAHAFRTSVGVPPHRYVVERRMEMAKLLLRDTVLPIATIAARVGYSTHAHFSVTFNRVVGMNPNEFRRKQ